MYPQESSPHQPEQQSPYPAQQPLPPGQLPPPSPVPLNPATKVGNQLTVMQPGEVVIAEIKRHPIGIIGIYVSIALVLLLVIGLIFMLTPSLVSDSNVKNQITQGGSIVFLILTTIFAVYALIATKVYWGNSWIVTSDSITQIQQTSLFNRESSQLALVNIENVTAEKKGILPMLFNYGTLKAETAGHHEKFMFIYCPNPNLYAQQILAAREALRPTGHH